MSEVIWALAFKMAIGWFGFVVLVTGSRFFERIGDFLFGFIEGRMEEL